MQDAPKRPRYEFVTACRRAVTRCGKGRLVLVLALAVLGFASQTLLSMQATSSTGAAMLMGMVGMAMGAAAGWWLGGLVKPRAALTEEQREARRKERAYRAWLRALPPHLRRHEKLHLYSMAKSGRVSLFVDSRPVVELVNNLGTESRSVPEPTHVPNVMGALFLTAGLALVIIGTFYLVVFHNWPLAIVLGGVASLIGLPLGWFMGEQWLVPRPFWLASCWWNAEGTRREVRGYRHTGLGQHEWGTRLNDLQAAQERERLAMLSGPEDQDGGTQTPNPRMHPGASPLSMDGGSARAGMETMDRGTNGHTAVGTKAPVFDSAQTRGGAARAAVQNPVSMYSSRVVGNMWPMEDVAADQQGAKNSIGKLILKVIPVVIIIAELVFIVIYQQATTKGGD